MAGTPLLSDCVSGEAAPNVADAPFVPVALSAPAVTVTGRPVPVAVTVMVTVMMSPVLTILRFALRAVEVV